jgi:cbb3-type cytochrome oxidase subunit 3
MEVFRHIKKIIQQKTAKLVIPTMLIAGCLFYSMNTFSKQYQLEVLAQLPSLSSENIVTILPLHSKVADIKPYLLADEKGVLSILNGKKLTVIANLPLNNQATAKQVKLTSLALHPSFFLVNQPGYQTFFTAHIEPVKRNNNVARLTILKKPSALPFDAVITQWKFDNTVNIVTNIADLNLDTQHKREVMRIAVPTATHQIQKIAFNPYSKVWHDDYGLLHIALSDKKNKQINSTTDALYSGVILRINPAKFGLRNYMVPNNNPFIKNHLLNNEILIVGAQKISSFTWSKQHYETLILKHTYNNNQLLTIAMQGADWRNSYQEKLVHSLSPSQSNINEIFSYNGRSLKGLLGNILYLSKNAKQWQITAINITAEQEITEQKIILSPTSKTLNSNELSSKNIVKLLFNHTGDPLLLDITSKKLLKLIALVSPASSKNQTQISDKTIVQPDTVNSSAYGTLLLILFLSIIAIIFYRLRPKNNATKAQLRAQFARFDLNEDQTMLLFYKRHQPEVDSKLAVTDIVASEIRLNNASLNIISEDNDNGYDQQRESDLRVRFTKEHHHKLIDDEIRQVHLYLTDNHAKEHIVCLYLRKGNQRFTKAKYFNVLESIIDWNWFIAKKLNPQATEKRKIKIAIDIQPAVKVPTALNKKKPADNTINTHIKDTTKLASELHNIAIHDTELINALDKLANLKQKGFLTENEFSLAKAKILADITRNK